MFNKNYLALQAYNVELIKKNEDLNLELKIIKESRLFKVLKILQKIFHLVCFWNHQSLNNLRILDTSYRNSKENFIFFIINGSQNDIKYLKKQIIKDSRNIFVRLGISFFIKRNYYFKNVETYEEIRNIINRNLNSKFTDSKIIFLNPKIKLKSGLLSYIENQFKNLDCEVIISDLQSKNFKPGNPQSSIMPNDPIFLLHNLNVAQGFMVVKDLHLLKDLDVTNPKYHHRCQNDLLHEILISINKRKLRIKKSDQCLIYVDTIETLQIKDLCNFNFVTYDIDGVVYPLFNKIFPIKSSSKIDILIPTRGSYAESETEIEFEKVIEKNLNLILSESNLSGQKINVNFIIGPELTHAGAKTLDGLNKKYNFSIIESKEKFNFSERINLALKNINTDYFLLLNDDILLQRNGFIKPLINHFDDKSVGVVGTRLAYPNGLIQHAGVTVTKSLVDHYLRGFPITIPHIGHTMIREVSAVTAAFCVFPKKIVDEVGLFDLNFPIEFGDIDFMLKIKNKNFKIIYDPRVTAWHFESLSRGKSTNIDHFIQLCAKWDLPNFDPYYLDPA